MPKTFLQLGQQLVEDAGISGTLTSMVSQSGEFLRVVNWIKRAVTEIEGKWLNWDFLHEFHTFNTVVGVRDYPAPSNFNLWDTSTAKILAEAMPLPYMQWTRRKLDITEAVAGAPYEFTVLPDKSIRLYDTPTAIVTIDIEYWRIPTVLTANTDEPSIPEQFRDIIVSKALQFYANYESAEEVKVQAVEIFKERMLQLQSHSAPGQQAKDSITTGADIVVSTPNQFDDYY